MSANIQTIISVYNERYQNIFKYYYPAHGSTGFTERNLSVNFANAIESSSKQVLTWYEVPIGEKKREHFDAMVVDMDARELFIIESKRFSNARQKLASVGWDIQRITSPDHIMTVCKELHLSGLNHYKTYGVILADVWLENKLKKAIFENWKNGFLEVFQNELALPADTLARFGNCQWFTREFSPTEAFPNAANYKLLVMVFEVLP